MLVVEHDLALRTAITYHLRQEGHVVLALGDAKLASELVRENPLSLLVFDPIHLDTDGLSLCQFVRSHPLTHHLLIVLLLTREREITQIEQLGLQITDYVLKPLLWEELRACIQTLLHAHKHERPQRRAKRVPLTSCPTLPSGEEVLTFGDFSIDLAQRRVLRETQVLDIHRPLLFDLLVYLVRHRGIALTRTQLLTQVWGYVKPAELGGDTHTVSVHIRLPASFARRGSGASPLDPNRAWHGIPFP